MPHFRGPSNFLRLKWQEAEAALAHQQTAQACRIFLSIADQTPASDSLLSGRSAFLFSAAHNLLAAKSHTAADHCLQKGLSLLTCCSEHHNGALNDSPWLVMASSALIREDLESCSVWLRRASQTFLHSSRRPSESADELLHWNGDGLAIEACRQARIGGMENADGLLNRAHQCHTRAGAFLSAAKDLILRARVRILLRQWDAAESDLLEAQDCIKLSESANDDLHRNTLCLAIDGDLRSVRAEIAPAIAAKWN